MDTSRGGWASLSDREFEQLRRLAYELAGLKISDQKRELVASRVGRRVRALELTSFAEYCALVSSGRERESERVELVNCLTTNKTDFYREAHHFDLLRDAVIPAARARAARDGRRVLRVWSAGCSTGEEPYTIAITLREALGRELDQWDARVIATDIDTEVLACARRGVYAEERLAPIPWELRRRHFLRGRGADEGTWKVRPETAALVRFERVNLVGDQWPVPGGLDAIFCRNVVIYFDRATQSRLFSRFAEQLAPHGILFVGHSESVLGLCDRFALIGRTAHRLVSSRADPSANDASAAALEHHRIVAGEVRATIGAARIATLLGSCVSACLYDPLVGAGGMNHFMLPEGSEDRSPSLYGVHAMELLVGAIQKLGGDRRRLRAKVAGASTVTDGGGDVARQNAEFVRGYLSTEGIPLDGERLGGTSPLEAHFFPHEGKLLCRVAGAARAQLRSDEARISKLAREVTGTVELFTPGSAG